ncbi:hypothetical protein [Hymenobacter sublimis]|uniref:Uncharacterized protein n=1 Tax=Hymenobacter sublimis TaxID=2933777 RepID=A0ABY4JCV6_9BACT|nr:hypothetical protein [Hymenobacter sublimis]UPL50646.1 hypothetical protein MWH26_07035 [Hymenobacter sublimis]
MPSLFQEVFERARREKRLLGVRSSQGDPSRFSVGYVLSYSEEVVVLRIINRDGMPTAIQSFNLLDVFQLDFDDQYTRHVEFKADNLDKVYAGLKSPAFLEQEDLTVPLLLERAHQAGQLVNVYTHLSMDYYGYVRQLTQEHVLMECFTEYGLPDGLVVFRIEDVRNFIWSNEDTRVLELRLKQRGPLGA